MREIRPSGLEGGGALRPPYPYFFRKTPSPRWGGRIPQLTMLAKNVLSWAVFMSCRMDVGFGRAGTVRQGMELSATDQLWIFEPSGLPPG